jgi:hypothetical protein
MPHDALRSKQSGKPGQAQKSQFSNRGAFSRFNETVGGYPYNLYHTLYKTSGGTKKVNGYNIGSSTRYFFFNNGNGTQNVTGAVVGNSRWFTSASSWSFSDGSGSSVLAGASPSSSLLPQDSVSHSTTCMVIVSGCN